MAATLVWLPAETQWVEATLIRSVAGATPTSTTAVCIRQDIGTEVTVPQMHLLQREQLPPGGLADLTQLSYLHEPAILDNLRLRFCCGQAPPASAGGAAEPHADAWAALQAKFAALDERAETELISASSAGDLADGAHSPPPLPHGAAVVANRPLLCRPASAARPALQKRVYTYCGRICIAVNPYERLPDLYTVRPPPWPLGHASTHGRSFLRISRRCVRSLEAAVPNGRRRWSSSSWTRRPAHRTAPAGRSRRWSRTCTRSQRRRTWSSVGWTGRSAMPPKRPAVVPPGGSIH